MTSVQCTGLSAFFDGFFKTGRLKGVTMTKETIQKEHRILQLKYAVLAVVVGICVGIVDTIFGRGLLAISDLRTAYWQYLLPFLPPERHGPDAEVSLLFLSSCRQPPRS